MSCRQSREHHECRHACSHCPQQIAYPALTLRCLLQPLIPRALTCAAILILAAVAFTGSARADGDPASDVLAVQPLFLPWDANVPSTWQAQLQRTVTSAQRGGFPIRVAVIASPTDLGSVGALWRQPRQYAEFLGQELSLVYKGPLFVVMPNGFGLHGFAISQGAISSVLAGIRTPTNGAQLAQVTVTAIERLAGAAGHPLPSASAGADTVGADTIAGRGSGSAIGPAGWAVFLIGCLSIAIAWTISLRAKPLRHKRATPT
jgi:hypothetical protein